MITYLILFQSIVLLLVFGVSKSCFIELDHEGSIEFPAVTVNRSLARKPWWWGRITNNECALMLRTNMNFVTELEFTDVQNVGNPIKVVVAKKHKAFAWKLKENIPSSQPSSNISFSGQKAVKIVVKKNSEFKLRYMTAFCPVHRSVGSEWCSNKKAKGSTCIFLCRAPLYLPAPSKNPKFVAKCRTDHTWSVDATEHCTSSKEMADICLDSDSMLGACSLSVEELIPMFSESAKPSDKSRAYVTTMAFLTKGDHQDVDWQIPKPRGVARGLTFNDCYKYCLRSSVTKDYITSCGNKEFDRSEKTVCLQCRYKYKICEKKAVFY